MKKLKCMLFSTIAFGAVSCIQIHANGHISNDDATPFFTKKFDSGIQFINARLVADNIVVKGDTKGETSVTVRVSGNGVNGLSANELQNRVDKNYEIQIEQNGNQLTVAVKQKSSFIPHSEEIDFDIEVHTGANSSAKIKTVSGNIAASSLANADVQSVSGDIVLQLLSGNANASSVSGGIKGVDINSIDDVNSVSGDININIAKLPYNAAISSTSGNIKLNVPSDLPANINFNSTSGDIKINNINKTNYSSKEENKVTGTLNAGGKNIVISTVSGDIHIN